MDKNISNALKQLCQETSVPQEILYTETDIVNAYVVFKNVVCDYMRTNNLSGNIKEPEQACLLLFNTIGEIYGIDMFDVIAKSDGQ